MGDENIHKELQPRNYQEKLIKIGIQTNSIIYLPTGSGKTFIAVCVLKELSKVSFDKPYSNGGKISFFLVNTVSLVHQHTKYLRVNTAFNVSSYTGEMNVDFWDLDKWLLEYNNNNILVMTAQIMSNLLTSNLIDLNKVNLIVFDECHQGVEAHAMRQIMMCFQSATEQPRVLGLTATLLNGNVKSAQVLNEVRTLETTFHAKVATVDELKYVFGFSTNPTEIIMIYNSPRASDVKTKAIEKLSELSYILRALKLDKPLISPRKSHLPNLDPEKGMQKWYKLVDDAIYHIDMLGIYGGKIGIICYTFHFECEKRQCTDINAMHVLNSIISTFTYIKKLFEKEMLKVGEDIKTQLFTYSSHKVLRLIEILKSYHTVSELELCGIIFVQRRNTAKFMYHILKDAATFSADLVGVKADFMIGHNANPLNNTKEALYYTKINKKVVEQFNNKETNLLIASNVIEEGIDIPTCSLVVKFDTPTNYREYLQSKGRAREKRSLYYIMVEQKNCEKFRTSYTQYQQTENDLNDYLIGKNNTRAAPSDNQIMEMYEELPPYYVDGPGSAQITLLNCIQMLMMYCNSLPTDTYTIYEPDWFLEKQKNSSLMRVVIEMPLICPVMDPVYGKWVDNKKDAKRSAAYAACILLFKLGELSMHLLPKKIDVDITETEFLFKQWPADNEVKAGINKMRRIYTKNVPKMIASPIISDKKSYLHIIDITPSFKPDTIDLDLIMLHKLYSSNLCFGFVTSKKLPEICQFPIFASAGGLDINIRVNANTIELTENQIAELSAFHHLVFAEVLNIVKSFLMLSKTHCLKNMLLVPINKLACAVDFEVVETYKDVHNQTLEMKLENKLKLVVDTETYLGKIVTPWYRQEDKQYVVIQVCDNMNANSQFPTDNFSTFASYFADKYNVNTFNPTLPLLLVKTISSRLNHLKPRGIAKRKRKEDSYEDIQLHLIPEMCVKQEFPGCLWVQAKLLPTILHRVVQLLRAEELRRNISKGSGMGVVNAEKWLPLELDMHLLTYRTELSEIEPTPKDVPLIVEVPETSITLNINKEFVNKMQDSQYPWTVEEEPKDIDRDLSATVLDIEYFVKFIKEPVNVINLIPDVSSRLAISYDHTFVNKRIELLKPKINLKGPELRTIYQALMTAKCNDIVNLERLETLGDSFLKLIASLYIFIKFPRYNEGQATALKGKMVSNKNLFYLANKKQLGSFLKMTDLTPGTEWLPIGYSIPNIVQEYIDKKEMPIGALFDIDIPYEEQVSGILTEHTIVNSIQEARGDVVDDDDSYSSLCSFLGIHTVPDKVIADVAEALIGTYFESLGFKGAVQLTEWLGIIPATEKMLDLLKEPPSNPIINKNNKCTLDFLLPPWVALKIEKIIGYTFKDRAYLLQAYTHSSYTQNRLTMSYERLEYIGDAVLDFLITCHIYESCGRLDPGELTDLRSALVNNETFASFVVRLGLHRYILHYNSVLNSHIAKFTIFQESKKHEINDDVLILLNESDLKIGENVDVPKVLGDIFESLAGAIYLDSGMDLNVVWDVFYKIMHKEIHLFSQNVPKNPIRLLYDTPGARAIFHPTVELDGGTVMIKLDFMLKGSVTRVHGFGDNTKSAKKASAKIALRLLKSNKSC